MFIAAYTFFPCECAYVTTFSKSSCSIFAFVLNDIFGVPIYIASAPYLNAIIAFSYDPAGASNSISLPYLFFLKFPPYTYKMRVPSLLACTLIFIFLFYLSNVIFLTLYSTIPTGASTCITSPTFAPK